MDKKIVSLLAFSLLLSTMVAGCLGGGGIGEATGGYWRVTPSPEVVSFSFTNSLIVGISIEGISMNPGEQHEVEIWFEPLVAGGDPNVWGITGRQGTYRCIADQNGKWSVDTSIIVQFNEPSSYIVNPSGEGLITLKIDGEPGLESEGVPVEEYITLSYVDRSIGRAIDTEGQVYRNLTIFNPLGVEYTMTHEYEIQEPVTSSDILFTHEVLRGTYNITWTGGYRVVSIDVDDKVIDLRNQGQENLLEWEPGAGVNILFGSNAVAYGILGIVGFIVLVVVVLLVFRCKEKRAGRSGKLIEESERK